MKAIFFRYLRWFARIVGALCSFRVNGWVKTVKNIVRSEILSGFFKNRPNAFQSNGRLFLVGPKFIEVGDNVSCEHGVRLEAIHDHLGSTFQPSFKIGNRVSINHYSHIGCSHSIHIGDDVLIAARVFITDHYHGSITHASIVEHPPSTRKLHSPGPVVIEDGVWLGEGVCVLPGVRIGSRSIIGANAVVTKDIPPFSVAAGVPARIIKRFIS